PAAVRDPRLEPMRRAADQVTLQFRGEDGLEGRLRISVRGDSVRASILSSHDGTLQRAGSELASLKRALADQGFTDAKLSVTDTRTVGTSAANSAKEQPQTGEERRHGEPQKKQSHGRETRQDGGSPNRGRREPRDERRDA
ncbi:MAG: flagellar hook-length control protein FliK, partial [Candidatus Eisenbacteria bacterium]|nr:flagellar hook-length control protein FliK [Candidatus Eisenbacteria bacterium]